MRGRSRYWAVLIALFVSGLVAFAAWTAHHRSAQITLRMKPVTPLTTTVCVAEARRFGYSPRGAATICSSGPVRSWYHADLTNDGPGAYPLCEATAFDSHGKAVFRGHLVFAFGGFPAGLFAPGHQSIVFDWYLPQKVSATVTRYAATCTADSSPPI